MADRDFLDRLPNLTNLLVILGVVVLGVSFYVPYGTASRVARTEERALRAARDLLALAVETEPDLHDEDQVAAVFAAFTDRVRRDGLPDSWMPERQPVPAAAQREAPRLIVQMKHYMLQLARTPADKLTVYEGTPEPDDGETTAPADPDAWPRDDGRVPAAKEDGDNPEGNGGSRATGQIPSGDRGAGADPGPAAQEAPGAPASAPLDGAQVAVPARGGTSADRLPFEVHAWPAGNLGAGYTAFYLPESGIDAFTRNKAARLRGLDNVPWPGTGQPRPGRSDLAPDPRIARTYRDRSDERWILLPPPPAPPETPR